MTRRKLTQQALDILKCENKQLYNTLAWYIGYLEKENEELIRKADCCMWLECNKISEENEKLKNTIKQAIELLSIDGQGTKQEVKKLLSEVLGNE